MIQISGTVETIIYKNEETGFTVLELDHDGEPLTVVGELSSVGEGEVLTLHGSFRTHPSYGTQFKAVAAEQQLPATASAILRYLASGAIKGIGPVLASRMVAQFGDDTLKVLENEPQRLTEVQGISPAKCEKLREELGRMFGMRAVMLFLSQFGIKSSTAVAIWKRWGTMAQKIIEENPYLLCSEEIGLSFDDCEAIARRLGVPRRTAPTASRRRCSSSCATTSQTATPACRRSQPAAGGHRTASRWRRSRWPRCWRPCCSRTRSGARCMVSGKSLLVFLPDLYQARALYRRARSADDDARSMPDGRYQVLSPRQHRRPS